MPRQLITPWKSAAFWSAKRHGGASPTAHVTPAVTCITLLRMDKFRRLLAARNEKNRARATQDAGAEQKVSDELLRRTAKFGIEAWRPGQWEAIRAVIVRGVDAWVTLRTGGGKTLIAWCCAADDFRTGRKRPFWFRFWVCVVRRAPQAGARALVA